MARSSLFKPKSSLIETNTYLLTEDGDYLLCEDGSRLIVDGLPLKTLYHSRPSLFDPTRTIISTDQYGYAHYGTSHYSPATSNGYGSANYGSSAYN
jgi:hypothetical protein